MKLAITGHRPSKLGNDYEFTGEWMKNIKIEIQGIINREKPTEIIVGMALGVDTLFAIMAIENNIPFRACIPCNGQANKWTASSRKLYYELLNHPLCTIKQIHDGPYTDKCMQERNIYMVDECDKIIAVWDGTSGGTANCVSYAKAKDKEILRINPTILKPIYVQKYGKENQN